MSYISIAELRDYLDLEDTTTFTADAVTDNLTLVSVPFVNTLKTATEVTLTSSLAVPDLPAPLVVNTTYYVILVADQAIRLAATSANAAAGTQIDIIDAGTGTHTIVRCDADTALLTDAISAAQTYIESQTNRVFEAATLTKYYLRDALDNDDRTLLHLGADCLTVTTLSNGDSSATPILPANYWLLNRNLGPPYHWIKLKANTGVYWEWDTDYWVSVAGTWGYSTTPPGDIKTACLHLAAFYYRQRDTQVWDVTAIPDAGVITIPQGIPATVTRIIDRYRRHL